MCTLTVLRKTFAASLSTEGSSQRGPGNSDSVLSGSLASPKPPEGGEPKEHGDEENETQSRGDIQGPGGLGGGQRRQDAGRIGRAISACIPPRSRNGSSICWRGPRTCLAGPSRRRTRRISRSSMPRSGQLALENDFLEGALIKAGLLSAKR